MYTVAFYSHRGGVERTRALANVAVELVRRGRKVLVVDFDLEAPTLDTLGVFQSADEAEFERAKSYLVELVHASGWPDDEDLVLDDLRSTLKEFQSIDRAEFKRARDSLLVAEKELLSSKAGKLDRTYGILEETEKSFQLDDEGLRPGLLEYVTAFRRTGQVPDVLDYLYEAPRAAEEAAPGGKLWVMPAGRWNRRGYRRALARLDWIKLYKKGGFEFFERTKARWQEGLNPDHVLLGCPSGWTNVEGICTRQLADAVVVFCPYRDYSNRNSNYIVREDPELIRTAPILKDIETETDRGRPNEIAVHFVWYDLPADTDPDVQFPIPLSQVLLRRPLPHKNLKPAAALPRERATLTEDDIVVRTKLRSGAARQYRRLTDAILIGDPKDREGARLFLDRMKQAYAKGVAGYELEDEERRLDAIKDHFWDEPDILLRAGECLATGRRFMPAIFYLDRALELRPGLPEALYHRAVCYYRLGDRDAARRDLSGFLSRPDIARADMVRGLRELYSVVPEEFQAIRDQFASRQLSSREQRELSARFVRGELPDWVLALPPLEGVKLQILLEAEAKPRTDIRPFIRQGRFGEALQGIAPRGRNLREMDLEDLIDLAMARWGLVGELSENVCAAIRDRDAQRAPEERRNPAYGQVIALALWRLGEQEEARKRLDEARQEAAHRFSDKGRRDRPIRSLPSCWRYADVSFDQFTEDCHQIRRLIDGAPIRPPFLDRAPRA